MKRLILLAGLPGVGKTTISKGICERIVAQVVPIDKFKKPSVGEPQIDPPDLRWSYYQEALEEVFDLFNNGIHAIVMDEVFHVGTLRSKVENACATQGAKVIWIHVECPYELVEQRLKSNERKDHLLRTDTALRLHLEFKEIFDEFPAHSSNHIKVYNDGSLNLDELVQAIQKLA